LTPYEAVIGLAAGAYLVLVALLVGSFINLAADRVPRGESVIRPRSHCRSCDRVLNAVDLLPVVGYLVRAGRCASCGVPIGVFSPVIEALCGGAMLAALGLLGLWPGALVGFVAIAVVGAAALALSRLGRPTTRGSQTG
jgi:prepilin signal peptidase PulO-like enzyme (type II secretory pathway)